MNEMMFVVTPFLMLLILAVFGFTGCGEYLPLSEDPKPAEDPKTNPPGTAPPGTPVTPPVTPDPAADAYEKLVMATAGFAAYWPLNEPEGTPNISDVANVVGPLNPAANGSYMPSGASGPTSYKTGQKGVLNAKDSKDFAPEFAGKTGFVDIQFQGPLNPLPTVAGFSIELWVKPYPTPQSEGQTQVLISSHRFDSPAVQQGYEIALIKDPTLANQSVRGRVFQNGQLTDILVKLPQGDPTEWRHIVLTYEQSATVPVCSLHVRIPGQAQVKDGPHGAKYEAVVSAKPSTLRFAAGHATGQAATNFFSGRIDCIAFYNAVLSQTDIDNHFAAF